MPTHWSNISEAFSTAMTLREDWAAPPASSPRLDIHGVPARQSSPTFMRSSFKSKGHQAKGQHEPPLGS
jgi:hypothetical protein